MFKKILAFCFVMMSIPLYSNAISLSELENNSEQYVLAYRDKEDTVYVDRASIQSSGPVRPNFGYISGIVYNVNVKRMRIKQYSINFQYFFTDSYPSVYPRIYQEYPHLTDEMVSTYAMKQIFNFSGIVAFLNHYDTFMFDGTDCYDSGDYGNAKVDVPYPSPMCSAANCMFAINPKSRDHEDFTLKAPGQTY